MNIKQTVKSIVFIIIFIYILITVTYIVRTNGDIKDIFTGFYAEPDNTIDVVMIGSSPVYPFYSTPQMWGEYGIAAYPVASNLQRPAAGTYLVKEVRKTQSPSLYIFEMRMYTAQETDITNNMAYTRGVTDNMKYSLNRIETINALVDDASQRYTYYFDIFKYHSNWKTMVLPKQLASFRYELLDDQKGYVLRDEVGPCEAVDNSKVAERMPVPKVQEEHLYRLLNYLKDEKLQALFIVSPYAMEEEKAMMYNYIEDIVVGYGYNFFDMNDYYEEIGLDFSADFGDYGIHTNALGAAKCTTFLADYIQDNYSLTDKRGDSRYKKWDKAYEQWKKEYEQAEVTIANRIANGDFAEVAPEE